MAAQELQWLTYLLTDLGEQPRSPPVLYVDNKAMIALCQEHRLEHRMKHIALQYFRARELQQRGQLLLAYVATRANTADVFTKALPPGDHQRFATLLACFAFLTGLRLTLQTYLDNLAANRDLADGFHGNRAFASAADKADWDEQNVDGASEEAGPLSYCSMDIPMDDDNPRESVNAETYFDFADTGYVTPQPVDTNVSERLGPNFLPDPEAGDEAAFPEDTNLGRLFHSPAMAVLDNPATGDDDPDERPALTGLDFLLSILDLDKAARATPDTIPTQKAPAAPVISLSADHVAETSAEPTVDSQSQIPTQTTARTTRLKQATLTFGKTASSTANVNNAPGTSDRPRPRLNINLTGTLCA
ncbi:unnamed protein product [Closterium sp. NIES-53]